MVRYLWDRLQAVLSHLTNTLINLLSSINFILFALRDNSLTSIFISCCFPPNKIIFTGAHSLIKIL